MPGLSPYSTFGNNPIYNVDPHGDVPNPFRLIADLFKSFTHQTTSSFIKAAAQSGYFNRPDIKGSVHAITRLGRIYESAVLESLGETKNWKTFKTSNLPGARSVQPDLVGQAGLNYLKDPLKPQERDRIVFPNATFIDAKFKGEIIMSDEFNPNQMRGMIDALSNMKGGYVNDKWNPSIKASDYGVASLTLITPENTQIDAGILEYATKKNVVLFQRTTQQDKANQNSIRVSVGGKQLNTVATQHAVEVPKGPGQSAELNYNIR